MWLSLRGLDAPGWLPNVRHGRRLGLPGTADVLLSSRARLSPTPMRPAPRRQLQLTGETMRAAGIYSTSALTLALMVAPTTLAGQPQQDVHLRNDCRLAQQVLVHGQPADKHDWALGVISNCGREGADILAAEMRKNRMATARSPRLDLLAGQATMMVDSAIFDAALSIATDRSAGEAARIHALSVLYTQLTGGYQPYEDLVQPYTPGATIILHGPSTSASSPTERMLPADAQQQAWERLRGVAVAEMNPVIREAARRVCAGIESGESGDQATRRVGGCWGGK